jgi:hypothetical protein
MQWAWRELDQLKADAPDHSAFMLGKESEITSIRKLRRKPLRKRLRCNIRASRHLYASQ